MHLRQILHPELLKWLLTIKKKDVRYVVKQYFFTVEMSIRYKKETFRIKMSFFI